ncbi:hypothetical protein Bbelb_016690 [Branchiostoma belcheri]|nr:hypothetical protein Bbelb_016690 [Branchiostoma belcheri]
MREIARRLGEARRGSRDHTQSIMYCLRTAERCADAGVADTSVNTCNEEDRCNEPRAYGARGPLKQWEEPPHSKSWLRACDPHTVYELRRFGQSTNYELRLSSTTTQTTTSTDHGCSEKGSLIESMPFSCRISLAWIKEDFNEKKALVVASACVIALCLLGKAEQRVCALLEGQSTAPALGGDQKFASQLLWPAGAVGWDVLSVQGSCQPARQCLDQVLFGLSFLGNKLGSPGADPLVRGRRGAVVSVTESVSADSEMWTHRRYS